MATASFLTGLGSIAVWNFGREVIGGNSAAGGATATVAWMILGVAGVVGALGGDAVERIGLPRAWTIAVTAMAVATACLPHASGHVATVLLAAGVFGAAYIALTGLLLLWSTRVYPDAVPFGVGMSFFSIAAGQALGAPLAGASIEFLGTATTFAVFALLGAGSAILRPARAVPQSAGDRDHDRSITPPTCSR